MPTNRPSATGEWARLTSTQTRGLRARPALRESGPSRGDRIAAWLTRRLGAMTTVWLTLVLSAIWMVLGARAVLAFDPYPYPVLLFVGNVVQLLLIFVILVGQRILGAAGERRSEQTYHDAQAILEECHRLQEQIDAQNRLLNRAAPPGSALEACDTAPILIAPPQSLAPATATRGRRTAARLVRRLGSMNALYVAVVLLGGWMLLAVLGVVDDPYPFPFLLFCSSLAQLVLMFVIMVGQDVLGEASDRRAIETADHTAVVLQQCRHLRQHLHDQDALIRELTGRAEEPAGRAPLPRAHDDEVSRSGRS